MLIEEQKINSPDNIIRYLKFIENESDVNENVLVVGLKKYPSVTSNDLNYVLYKGVSVDMYNELKNDKEMESYYNLYIHNVYEWHRIPKELIS